MTKKFCSKHYYTSGSAWVWKTCTGEGLYYTEAWFYNKSGKLVARRTSKMKPIRC